MVDEPTIGEAMRRLDRVSKEMETLARQMAEDRRDFARVYVPRETWETNDRSLDRRVTLLEAENKSREDDEEARRRQYTFIAIGVTLTAVASFLVSMATLLGDRALGG
jgi:t-SNARE complex subunit (syntaxin)